MLESILKLQEYRKKGQKVLTIPKEMCKILDFNRGDLIRVVLKDKHIIVSKVILE